MQSHAHWLWFITKCSKLTERFNYTSSTVFDTFPWPQTPTVKQIDAVASAAGVVRRFRAEALPKMKGGLRALYRTLELPARIRSKTHMQRSIRPSSPPTASTRRKICSPNSSP